VSKLTKPKPKMAAKMAAW